MSVRSLIAFGALLGSSALADDSTERAKLNGSWQAEGEGGAPKTVWILESRGDTFHIANSQGAKTIADFACVLGQECEVKVGGRKVKVTMYFNGTKLVEMKVKGEEVVKHRFGAGETRDARSRSDPRDSQRQDRNSPLQAFGRCGIQTPLNSLPISPLYKNAALPASAGQRRLIR